MELFSRALHTQYRINRGSRFSLLVYHELPWWAPQYLPWFLGVCVLAGGVSGPFVLLWPSIFQGQWQQRTLILFMKIRINAFLFCWSVTHQTVSVGRMGWGGGVRGSRQEWVWCQSKQREKRTKEATEYIKSATQFPPLSGRRRGLTLPWLPVFWVVEQIKQPKHLKHTVRRMNLTKANRFAYQSIIASGNTHVTPGQERPG